MTIWEPFIAGFTGTLTTFVTHSGYKFTLDNGAPKVVKGQPFMVQFDTEKNQIRMVPVQMPSPLLGMTRSRRA